MDARDLVKDMCDEALRRIDVALTQENVPQSMLPLLARVRPEVDAMRNALDPHQFSPGYGRVLLDWPESNELIEFLIDVKYRYDRLKPSQRTVSARRPVRS